MDGVLLVDKPRGPTSHDVVARIRRSSKERRIGHTGTLDPLATGLLPLVVGRATRLASWLSGGDKTYEATIRLGQATDTDDAEGQPIGEAATTLPDDADIDAALAGFRGTFDQMPPAHSAKKIRGTRAYELARQQRPVELKAVTVTVRAIDRLCRNERDVTVRVSASAGFYVRALARDLGQQVGCGAHLTALRRTGSGSFGISEAIGLDDAERLGPDVESRLITPVDALRDMAEVRVTEPGFRRVVHGNAIGPEHVAGARIDAAWTGQQVRLVGPDGRLVAIAEARRGSLHPVVVLG